MAFERRWKVPSKRAAAYALERKHKVHITNKKKEGQELTAFEAGLRSGYMQAQTDHAGIWKYKKALKAGKSVEEARKLSYEKYKGRKKKRQ